MGPCKERRGNCPKAYIPRFRILEGILHRPVTIAGYPPAVQLGRSLLLGSDLTIRLTLICVSQRVQDSQRYAMAVPCQCPNTSTTLPITFSRLRLHCSPQYPLVLCILASISPWELGSVRF